MNADALTTNDSSSWIDNCNIDATSAADVCNAARDVAADLSATGCAAANENPTPTTTNPARATPVQRRRFEGTIASASGTSRHGSVSSPDLTSLSTIITTSSELGATKLRQAHRHREATTEGEPRSTSRDRPRSDGDSNPPAAGSLLIIAVRRWRGSRPPGRRREGRQRRRPGCGTSTVTRRRRRPSRRRSRAAKRTRDWRARSPVRFKLHVSETATGRLRRLVTVECPTPRPTPLPAFPPALRWSAAAHHAKSAHRPRF